MNKVSKTSKKYIVSAIFLTIAASLSSCSSNPTYEGKFNITTSPTPNSETPVSTTQSPTQRTAKLNVQPRSESPITDKTVNVTLYTSDTQCQELVPQTITVAAQQPVTATVGKILEQRDNGDFSFSGYRVNIKNGVATVDLRLDPKSRRQITSLSSCEQFALFGSLRKTLTSNPQWGIKDVRFTERGEQIVL
ncbi:GerMN domain-containing protein [Fischerella thermalis]|uniref:Sporulation/spore germination protein n=1 Tax=Fischerella thermalis CCMEE 5318 TaxID=2019666 RepID=A0A2N6LK45_9CYAN|nr:GerMN domain-containing protein [Fischerella thermalis]PMB25083.1 sporulation/spore germination protein [Fischerella thermalis CCMEE 5318]PMB26873.1 sporulation/spore germination protein [Fischerella thermalis CCMEE 5319]